MSADVAPGVLMGNRRGCQLATPKCCVALVSHRSGSLVKLWGGRFDAGVLRDANAESFGASISFDRRLWPYDLLGSAAHCRMLAKRGIISQADARAIIDGLAVVAGELQEGKLDFEPVWEDIHTRVEGRLHELIGEPAGRLHTARSRNDQVATDLRLFARDALLEQADALLELCGTLRTAAHAHSDALMPGFTHLQHAQPVLYAHYLLAYEEMFARDLDRLLDCYARTNVLPLGSGALAGAPYPIDRSETARLLGFDDISANSLDAVSDRDFAVEHVAALAIVAVHLSRISEELVLWATTEFGFIRLADAHATGSSIMPQKRNPDSAELIRGKAGRVTGDLVALLTMLKGLPLAYNKDLQEDKEALFDAVDTVISSTRIMADMIATAIPQLERMDEAAGADFATATDYADALAKRGIPFREAHAIVGSLVRLCEERGCDLGDLTLDELRTVCREFGPEIVGLSPAAVAAARDVPGGTAPNQVAAALAAAEHRAEHLRTDTARLRSALPSLAALLRDPL